MDYIFRRLFAKYKHGCLHQAQYDFRRKISLFSSIRLLSYFFTVYTSRLAFLRFTSRTTIFFTDLHLYPCECRTLCTVFLLRVCALNSLSFDVMSCKLSCLFALTRQSKAFLSLFANFFPLPLHFKFSTEPFLL